MKQRSYFVLAFVTFLFSALVWSKGPIAQYTAYHQFADQRMLLGIPNFWDVVSNLPMFLLGAWMLWTTLRTLTYRPDFATRWIPVVLSIGVLMTGLGSGYYHYAPDNQTLVWDRLPMTVIFIPLFAMIVYDFMQPRTGLVTFTAGVPLGLFSIWYWQHTETLGQGDLRLYVCVQFLPMLLIPLILMVSEQKKGYVVWLWRVMFWYILAKVAEHLDHEIFELTGFWSGHTLKHFFAGVALWYVLLMLLAGSVIPPSAPRK